MPQEWSVPDVVHEGHSLPVINAWKLKERRKPQVKWTKEYKRIDCCNLQQDPSCCSNCGWEVGNPTAASCRKRLPKFCALIVFLLKRWKVGSQKVYANLCLKMSCNILSLPLSPNRPNLEKSSSHRETCIHHARSRASRLDHHIVLDLRGTETRLVQLYQDASRCIDKKQRQRVRKASNKNKQTCGHVMKTLLSPYCPILSHTGTTWNAQLWSWFGSANARWQVRRLFMRPALLLKVSKALGFLTGPALFLGSASTRSAVCKPVS